MGSTPGGEQRVRVGSSALSVMAAAALLLPPCLLVPLVMRMPGSQRFKDLYEACLWLSPAVGLAILATIVHRARQRRVSLRQASVRVVLVLGVLDLLSPAFFYVLLAVLAGR